ncbi:hypothetical protein F442_20213 [Phytophthora nicotianae P10297]|uniref:Uncharacterized protein n=1 Tax=Phytophthora nicotianae P10297 TaxID=1317064 RepID=W2Y894_PHYNI|nr:hypothetical protein F442_20213 [Phytophthora nicotianae P10297]
MSIVSTACAFSVIQCVTKRTRQLERLLYMLESTAAKFEQVKSCSHWIVFSSNTRAQVQSKYAKMLLDFLEKEQGLDISVLFKGSIHLESYHEELQQLLVLVEEEKLLRQRVAGTWDFIAAKSIDQNSVTLIRACENLWNDLLPQTSIVLPLINSIRGEPDSPSWLGSTDIPSAVHPWPSIVH